MLEKDYSPKTLNVEEQLSSICLEGDCIENTDEDEESWRLEGLCCLTNKLTFADWNMNGRLSAAVNHDNTTFYLSWT